MDLIGFLTGQLMAVREDCESVPLNPAAVRDPRGLPARRVRIECRLKPVIFAPINNSYY
jgi:hypothetical protein